MEISQLATAVAAKVLDDETSIKAPTLKTSPRKTRQAAARCCLDACELDDNPFTGPVHTWCNKQHANPIFTLAFHISNIALWNFYIQGNLIIVPVSSKIPSLPKPFKFYNLRASHPKFLHVVDVIWSAQREYPVQS
ncbi:hypothetical protein D5086_025396 [Populus alba]|uniref:Uncharacterized protein n=1 Tax=Populus alba TaxID=43335 RepID=A0ACC4AZW3_POPAL